MKPRLVIITLLVLALSFAAGYANAQTLKKQIVGTWSVLSNVNETDGKKVDAFGPNVKGQFIFTRDGRFSINIIRPGRSKFASNNRNQGTPEENKEAMMGYLGVFGMYTVTSDGSLTYHVIGSNFPNWDGTEQKRHVQINGDEMKLDNPTPSVGGTAVLMLKRIK